MKDLSNYQAMPSYYTGHNEQYVEQEAWDEQVTIYEDYAWDCCNVCRADITNNVNEHEKAHALAYEGGGHHIEYKWHFVVICRLLIKVERLVQI